MIPAAVETNPRLGTWLRVTGDPGHRLVEVSLGKVELGQGILTSLAQVAADGLALPLSSVRVRAAHTGGPDQGLTAGSLSLTQSAPALAHVGAVVRGLTGWTPDVPLPSYVERIAGLDPDTDLSAATPSPTAPRTLVGTDEPRLDLPDKVLGRPRYLTDLRPTGLLHGRVLRPPSAAASLRSLPDDWSAPGVRLVREGSFLGVVGEREDDVDRALASLAKAATWDERESLPDESDLPSWLRSSPAETTTVHDDPVGGTTHTASYSKPYLAHASIAPSCGMARWDGDSVHVWSHTQGVHPLRAAIAQALDLPRDQVSVEHVENAGCYGHNAADDAAYDAVLLARTVPGHPVLTRWTRPDELAWGPLSPAMTGTVSARLVDGRIDGWSYDVWGQGHGGRPGYAGQPGLLGHADATGTLMPPAGDPPAAAGHGTLRNATPLYDVGPRRIIGHRVTEPGLRTSAMRSLGAFFNVFAIESFIDELSLTAGADPVEFRLAHLSDPRARAVVSRAASEAGWGTELPDDSSVSWGRGIALARYKDKGAWCAVVAEVAAGTSLAVERLTVVADLGLVVNPDGARNQLSGGAVQATSWTTAERVRFDRRRITSADWESYPILRFGDVPSVDVHLIESDEPPLGAGECAQGPTAAAIANAIHAALGVRVRDLPLTTEAIQRTIEEES